MVGIRSILKKKNLKIGLHLLKLSSQPVWKKWSTLKRNTTPGKHNIHSRTRIQTQDQSHCNQAINRCTTAAGTLKPKRYMENNINHLGARTHFSSNEMGPYYSFFIFSLREPFRFRYRFARVYKKINYAKSMRRINMRFSLFGR